MTRPPRIEFQGAFYHIIVRGNQQQAIFYDDQDRLEYLKRIKRYKKEHGFLIYAYTLMTNHIHLLIETSKSPISKIMQVINLTYTQYFNRKYMKVGHLFQGRYKSFLCDRDEYLLGLVRYIHLNPVRARVVTGPHEYGWSSHIDYLAEDKKSFVEKNKVLRLFSESPTQARILYDDFIKEAIGKGRDETLYDRVVSQQILGNDRFIDEVREKIEEENRPHRKPSLKEVFLAVKEVTGVTESNIISRSRDREAMVARWIFAGVCRRMGYRLKELQPLLQRDISVLSRWSKLSENNGYQESVKEVVKRI